ncbi:MAG: hypothetical protein RR998_05110 [Oscillospiraceae bacterium]
MEIKKCNICGLEKPLSADHVPPKCCSNKGTINFYQLFQKNINPDKKPGQAQKGIYFKTICEKCNNELLGNQLDPFLGNLQEQIINATSQCTSLSDDIFVNIQINKVCRSVIGHLLAAFPHYYDGGIEPELRNYFLTKSLRKIVGQHLYLWINNEKKVAISRNIGIAMDPVFDGSLISLLKFPGAAFMLSNKEIDDNLVDLFDYTTEDFETTVQITLPLTCIFSKNGEERTIEWPLNVTDEKLFVISPEMASKSRFSTLIDI